jgi:hypothetical protein
MIASIWRAISIANVVSIQWCDRRFSRPGGEGERPIYVSYSHSFCVSMNYGSWWFPSLSNIPMVIGKMVCMQCRRGSQCMHPYHHCQLLIMLMIVADLYAYCPPLMMHAVAPTFIDVGNSRVSLTNTCILIHRYLRTSTFLSRDEGIKRCPEQCTVYPSSPFLKCTFSLLFNNTNSL